MKVRIAKVCLVALLLLLFIYSISLAGDPPPYRSTGKSTGNTWDEKSEGGGIIFSGKHRFFVDGYYIIISNSYTWVIVDLSKTINKSNSLKADQNIKKAQ